MAARVLAGAALVVVRALSDDANLDPALAADDACLAGSGECGVELRQLRGEMNSAQTIIAKQMEENKKFEVALDDESGKICTAPKGYKTSGISCGPGTKCCTSQPSYVAGTPHSAQSHLSLYSICCSANDHCKYDTIFVSCAAGRGPDDYSGVIAGLQEDGQTSEQAEDEVAVEQDVADDAAEELVDTEEAQNQEAVDAEDEDVAERAEDEVDVEQAVADDAAEELIQTEEALNQEVLDAEDENAADDVADEEDDAKVTGGKCMNKEDLKVWKNGGKQQYDAAMDHCGTSCAAGFPCTRDCMKKHGYSTGCASCMAHAVECGRDHCLSQCISNHKSKACLHCNKKTCRPVMKRCSGWAVGGH